MNTTENVNLVEVVTICARVATARGPQVSTNGSSLGLGS